MAGTERDYSAKVYETEGYPGTTSSTVDEVDVITPPPWAKGYRLYMTNAGRVGLAQSETMTTASVLEDADEHSPIPAGAWVGDLLIGGNIYISSATASTTYWIKFYRYDQSR